MYGVTGKDPENVHVYLVEAVHEEACSSTNSTDERLLQ